MDIPALQRAIAEQKLDGWLLYDFHGQNPTSLQALGLTGHMLTRRWFYLVPAKGTPSLLVHAIERLSFPKEVPGERASYSSWQSLRSGLEKLVAGKKKLAMEYCPMGAIPYLSRVDAGTLELIRSLGVEVVSSADLVQRFLCRWTPEQVESHVRALKAIDAAKDEAYRRIAAAHKKGETPLEHEIQGFLMERFKENGLTTDHPPIVAVNGHAGDPHYVPSEKTPTPIKKNDLVLIDLWAKEAKPSAVYADITWVGYCGDKPPQKMEEIFRITAEGRDVGLKTVTDGWNAKKRLQGWEVDRAVRDHIASRGYGDKFIHRTGHSIGAHAVHGDGANLDDLETHDTRELIDGVAFSIEPGIYLPDEGMGVRSEIDVVMTAKGPQVFSPIQKELVRVVA
jgi:Xaa-Pro aminopeptidase